METEINTRRNTPEWREYHRTRYKAQKEKLRSKKSDRLCDCGCGQFTDFALKTDSRRGQKKGEPLNIINGHNINILNKDVDFVEKRLIATGTFEARLKRSRSARRNYGSGDAQLSPFVPDLIIRFNKQSGYWNCRVRRGEGIQGTHHAKAVYEYHYGEVPAGFEVHHKNGQHAEILDDAPENLLAVPRLWNRDYLPSLISGFGIDSLTVTNVYLEVRDKFPESDHFKEVCKILLEL